MSRTSVEIVETRKGLIIVDSNERKDTITVYIRESVDDLITAEAEITMSSERFMSLIECAVARAPSKTRDGAGVV